MAKAVSLQQIAYSINLIKKFFINKRNIRKKIKLDINVILNFIETIENS